MKDDNQLSTAEGHKFNILKRQQCMEDPAVDDQLSKSQLWLDVNNIKMTVTTKANDAKYWLSTTTKDYNKQQQ